MAVNMFFKSSGFLIDKNLIIDDSSLDFSCLSPFLRALLTSDGTLTKMLESYFWEPVEINNVSQKKILLNESCEWLNKKNGSEVLQRNVSIQGGVSGDVFVRAKSLISLDVLPVRFRDELEAGVVGIGKLLRNNNLESFRELLDFGVDKSDVFIGPQVWRTYRIVISSFPVIQVTEYFPQNFFNVG